MALVFVNNIAISEMSLENDTAGIWLVSHVEILIRLNQQHIKLICC